MRKAKSLETVLESDQNSYSKLSHLASVDAKARSANTKG